jgi:Tol biopolymer transport system component
MTLLKRGLCALMLFLATVVQAQNQTHTAIALDPAQFDKNIGYYRLTPKIAVEFSRDGAHFFVNTGLRKIEIFPESSQDFFVPNAPVSFSFVIDAAGNVTGVTAHQGGNDILAPRIDAAAAQAIRALPPAPVGHPMARTWPLMQGIAPRSLTVQADGSLDYWPCFSPDGKSVLFSRTLDGGKSWTLLRVSTAGGKPVPFLRTSPGSATRADWSAKNNLVAFTVTAANGQNSIWIADGHGLDAHAVPGSDGMIYPSWYPDGKSLVATAIDFSVKQVVLAGGQTVTITDRAAVMGGMASVSPDGKTIAFAGQKSAGQPYNQEENILWLADAAGSANPLESRPLQGRAPVWSPDGTRLAFESDRGSPDGHYAIFVIGRDGTGLTQVTDYALNANHPVWSQDGRHMVFAEADPVQKTSTIAVIEWPAP